MAQQMEKPNVISGATEVVWANEEEQRLPTADVNMPTDRGLWSIPGLMTRAELAKVFHDDFLGQGELFRIVDASMFNYQRSPGDKEQNGFNGVYQRVVLAPERRKTERLVVDRLQLESVRRFDLEDILRKSLNSRRELQEVVFSLRTRLIKELTESGRAQLHGGVLEREVVKMLFTATGPNNITVGGEGRRLLVSGFESSVITLGLDKPDEEAAPSLVVAEHVAEMRRVMKL